MILCQVDIQLGNQVKREERGVMNRKTWMGPLELRVKNIL